MIEIRELRSLQDQFHARMIFDSVWPAMNETQITANLLQALVHSGSYLVGIFDEGKVLGASFAFPSIEPEIHLHSHMTAFIESHRDQGLGTRVKLHQWEWAKERKYASITWSYDPLVRRNARLNILKLGAEIVDPPFDAELIALPDDILQLRRSDPDQSARYRREVRESFLVAFGEGKKVTGFSSHNEYVLE